MTDESSSPSVHQLTQFIEEGVRRGTEFANFEPNTEPLWSRIRLDVGAFMEGLFRQGAFAGSSPETAYFVRCGLETTSQSDVDQGVVNIVVGFAPLKPSEFIILEISQLAGP